MPAPTVVLCHPVRTAIGTYGGSLKSLSAPQLGAIVIRETLKRAGFAVGVPAMTVNRVCGSGAQAVITAALEVLSGNVGCAVAHGHPIGATGAVLTTRLLHSVRRDGPKRGVVTLCIGGGQ